MNIPVVSQNITLKNNYIGQEHLPQTIETTNSDDDPTPTQNSTNKNYKRPCLLDQEDDISLRNKRKKDVIFCSNS